MGLKNYINEINVSLKTRIKIIITAGIVLIVSLVFNAALSVTTFEKFYVDTAISSNKVYSQDLKRNIELFLKFGKPLRLLKGVNKLLEETKRNNKFINNIIVVDKEATILYSINKKEIKTKFLLKNYLTKDDFLVKKLKNRYYFISSIRENFSKKQIGYTIIEFDEKVVTQKINSIINYCLIALLIVIVISLFIISGWINFSITLNRKGEISKFILYLVLLLVIGGAGKSYSIYTSNLFEKNIIEVSKDSINSLANLLKDDIEYLFSKKIKIDELHGIEKLFSSIAKTNQDVKDINIIDEKDRLLYFANSKEFISYKSKENKKLSKNSKEYMIKIPLYLYMISRYQTKKIEGYIVVNLNEESLSKKTDHMFYDSLTSAAIATIIMFELILLFIVYINREISIQIKKDELINRDLYTLARPLGFLFLLGVHVSISFMPLFAKTLQMPNWNISQNILIGLPISSELLFTAISFIFSGRLLEKYSWHIPFFVGLFVSMVGMILTVFSYSLIDLLIYRAITGFGYGLMLLSAQEFAIDYSSEKDRAKSLSNFFAGVYSGSISATAIGAMLVDKIGYKYIFLIGAFILILSLFYVIIFMRQTFSNKIAKKRKHKYSTIISFKKFIKFIKDKDFLLFMIAHVIPGAMIFAGFLYYVTPIYLKNIGVMQSDIGRVIMVYGLIMIYFSPHIGKLVDKYENKKLFLIISSFIGSFGLFVFFIFDGFLATLIAIIFLAIFMSIGISSKAIYVINLKSSKKYGKANTLGIYNAIERGGQALGPAIFAIFASFATVTSSMILAGIIFLIFTTIFLLSGKKS